MPREVVPIFRSPRRASLSRSSSRWYGRIRCALSLTSRRSPIAMPAAASSSISAKSACGSTTTPLPITQVIAGMEDARRQQPQHELPPVGVDRVPGVVPALIARDDGKVRREEVDDLALAFVAPLRAQYCNVHRHQTRSILIHLILLDGNSPDARATPGHRRRSTPRWRSTRAPRARSTPRAPSSIATPRGDTPVYGINTGFGSLAEVEDSRPRAGGAAAQPAAQPRRRRRRAAAGARGARDDGAARERAGEGLLRDPARDARRG